MKIDLSEITSQPFIFDEELVLEPDTFGLEEVAGKLRLHLDGTVVRNDVGFDVSGRFRVSGELRCARCLEPVAWQAAEDYQVQLSRSDHAPAAAEVGLEDDELEVVFLEDECLDLGRLAAEQVILNLPMRVVCDEDCAGLCPSCGGNRNTEDGCGCEPAVDPRWEGLRGVQGR